MEAGLAKLLLEAAPLAIVVEDAGGRIRSWNQAAARLLGWTEGEVLGKSFEDYRAGRDGARLRVAVTEVPADDPSGIGPGRVLFIEDVGERWQLEQDLLEVSGALMQRIGKDVHDGIGQPLSVLAWRLDSFLERIPTERPDLVEVGDELAAELRRCLTVTRDLARVLLPAEIEHGDLGEGLADLVRTTEEISGIPCRLSAPSTPGGPTGPAAAQLLRIVQEALANALRHAGATRLEVSLAGSASEVVLEVRDDGVGFVDTEGGGLGLRIMEARARSIGADLEVDSALGRGTIVRCRLPGPGTAED